jgi:hypothetical protein
LLVARKDSLKDSCIGIFGGSTDHPDVNFLSS